MQTKNIWGNTICYSQFLLEVKNVDKLCIYTINIFPNALIKYKTGLQLMYIHCKKCISHFIHVNVFQLIYW